MASKAVSAVLAVSLVAAILGSANLYLIYNVQQSFQNDLQSATRNLELANQALTESSQKLELLDQRLLSLQDDFGQANQDSQQQIANLMNQKVNLTN